ncbi:MAG: hypothetical protein GC199_08020 [Alphaproteobacteria bacterium]|nr:hypothetical protein [Alphaproteobacteria bacterium]
MASVPSRAPQEPQAKENEGLSPSEVERLQYLFEMLAELRRVSLGGEHKFLAYLIEMAANESARLLKGSSSQGRRRGAKPSSAA